MRVWILTALLAMAISRLGIAEPKLYIPEQRWDFGHVPQNSVLSHDYWIKNTGTDTLRIIRVKPG